MFIAVFICTVVFHSAAVYASVSCELNCLTASICPPYKTGTRQLPAPPLTPTKFLPGTAVCSFLPCAHFWFCLCTRVRRNNGSTSQCSGKMQRSDPNLQKRLQCWMNVVASWWKNSLQIRSWGVPVTLLAAAWEKSCTNPPAPSQGHNKPLGDSFCCPHCGFFVFCEKLMEWLVIFCPKFKGQSTSAGNKSSF